MTPDDLTADVLGSIRLAVDRRLASFPKAFAVELGDQLLARARYEAAGPERLRRFLDAPLHVRDEFDAELRAYAHDESEHERAGAEADG